MPETVDQAASNEDKQTGIGRSLVARKRGLLGVTSDRLAGQFFRINAMVSIVVLGLITFTLFRDAAGFIPQNRSNLEVYRKAGLEFVDLVRSQVQRHREISRELMDMRLGELKRLTEVNGLTLAEANARVAALDDFSEQFSDTIIDQEGLVSEMSDVASGIKERFRVAEDMQEARNTLTNAIKGATPERAAELRRELDAIVVEPVSFAAEIKPIIAMTPVIIESNVALEQNIRDVIARIPRFESKAVQQGMMDFRASVTEFLESIDGTQARITSWNPDKPVAWWESLNAFAFGRRWLTASFWQDWYGVLPLFFGSFLIAALALIIAIPLGVAAAVYTNQIASIAEQRFIKPYIEFISAIPSVVLGFFGIAVLGETLRRVSQVAWLDWVPGFPMIERLNAATAGCLLALMAVPTIFSIAEDAINNVPRSFKEASLAMGATRLQTILRIILPASLSGIMAAVLLGLGRVVGETMVVLLCAGNRIEIPDLSQGIGAFFQPVHTMTGIIAQEMGEVVRGSIHYRALFMVGALLFLISLLVNWLAQKIVRRYRISIG